MTYSIDFEDAWDEVNSDMMIPNEAVRSIFSYLDFPVPPLKLLFRSIGFEIMS